MNGPRRRRLVVAGLLAAALVLTAGWLVSAVGTPESRPATLWPEAGGTRAASPPPPTGTPPVDSAEAGAGTAVARPGSGPGAVPTHPCAGRGEDDVARYAFYGYLYGDGSQHGTRWHWAPSPSARSSARFRRGAQLNGVAATPFRPGDPATGYHGPGELPDADRLPDDCSVEAFLIGVIEGEGDADNGLVVDDPDRAHVEHVRDLFRRLGFRVTVDGGAIWAAWVDRADWPRFQHWPFAVRSRVPGGP